MRIGIFIPKIWVQPGFEEIVSGHVQIPLYTAFLLRESGHDVHLLTTPRSKEQVRPVFLPEQIPIHELPDASLQGSRLTHETGRIDGVRLPELFSLLRRLSRIIRNEKLQVIHFFGGNRTANFAGLCRLYRIGCPVVTTANAAEFPERHFWLTRYFWRLSHQVIASTEYFQQELIRRGVESRVIKHGLVRDLWEPIQAHRRTKPFRVLFWREATARNGGGMAVDVFERLAGKYPHISFDFALRPHWNEHPGVIKLAERMPNVNLYFAPYPEGISLARLLAESICVFQPFIAFSFQPQLSILESLMAGVPIVASSVQSSSEMIQHNYTGLVVSGQNADDYCRAIENLLNDANYLGNNAEEIREITQGLWNWDSYIPQIESIYKKLIMK